MNQNAEKKPMGDIQLNYVTLDKNSSTASK